MYIGSRLDEGRILNSPHLGLHMASSEEITCPLHHPPLNSPIQKIILHLIKINFLLGKPALNFIFMSLFFKTNISITDLCPHPNVQHTLHIYVMNLRSHSMYVIKLCPVMKEAIYKSISTLRKCQLLFYQYIHVLYVFRYFQ